MSLREKSAVGVFVVSGISLAFLSIAACYPGVMFPDSWSQYEQGVTGNYGDWHPPIMALLWSRLRMFGPGPGPLLIVHEFLFWIGLTAIAAGLGRSGHRRLGFAVIALGIFPLFWFQIAEILKDVGMAAALLCATGVVIYYKIEGRTRPLLVTLAVTILLAYAFLVRVNAIFALGPLITLTFFSSARIKPLFMIAVAAMTAFVGVLITGPINNHVIGATRDRAIISLEAFDRAGIVHFSRDSSLLPEGATIQTLDQCYTPRQWDPLGSKRCFRQTFPTPSAVALLKMIGRHPMAYLIHRLAHFNYEIYAFISVQNIMDINNYKVVCVRPHCIPEMPMPWFVHRINPEYFGIFPLFAPGLFFYFGIFLSLSLARSRRYTQFPLAAGSYALASSGVLYMLMFLFVGVASSMRYQLYPMLAISIASLLYIADRRVSAWYWRRADVILLMGSIALFLSIGLARML